MARVAIEVLSGQGAGRVAEIEGDAIRIGRAADNELVLGDERVSSVPARLEPAVDGLLVEDLESEGGTFLDRRGARTRLTRPTPLEPGDVLALGSEDEGTVRLCLRFEPEGEPDQIV